jgi:FAD-dependent monooxygenase
MRATEEVAMPMFRSAGEYGEVLIADTTEGEKARSTLAKTLDKGHWLHSQQGKILGLRYNDSPIIAHEPNGKEPPHNTTDYFPSTWPGVRPPHVLLGSRKTPIFDHFGKGYTLIEFYTDSARSEDSELVMKFELEARRMNIPLEVVHVIDDSHARKIWERDVVLIRPDGHVAWRCSPDWSEEDWMDVDVGHILRHVSGLENSRWLSSLLAASNA